MKKKKTSNLQTYFVPSDPTRIWKVPDQIDVRTINRQEADNKVFDTIDSYRQYLIVDVGITAFSSTALQTCAVQYNGNTTCSPGLISNSSKMFGIGADVQYLESKTSDNSKWIAKNTEKITLYSASLRQNLYILPQVRNDMQVSKQKNKQQSNLTCLHFRHWNWGHWVQMQVSTGTFDAK